eukprot:gene5588-biopygen573
MPAEITLQVARKTSEQIWRIDEILDIIRKEIEAREISRKLDTKTTRKSERTSLTEYRGTTRAFAVIKDGERERKLQCYFCQGEHYAEKSLHEDLVMEEKRGVPALQTTVNSASDERKNVLLQTAQTYGFGADRSEKQLVNILFDSGSQRSYISEETVKKLGLKVEKTETVYLNTFGSNKYEKKSCDRVTVNLEVGDEILTLTVLSSPHLCLPLSTPIDVSCYPHLQGLQLADSYATCEKRIELVIGVDYYYRIVQGEVRKGGNGLVAISSKLGWLLCGPVVCNEGDKSSLNNVMNLIVDVLPSRDEITDDSREIVESLTKFWKHESAGLYETENPEDKKTDDGGVDINFKDGRYMVVEILNMLYADDLSCGAQQPHEALEIYEKAKSIMLKGGFNLRKWDSNDKNVLDEIRKSEDSGETPAVEQGVVTGEDDQTFSEYSLGAATNSFDNAGRAPG